MYDELVKRLRLCAKGFRCRECDYENVRLCRWKMNIEAADAIENLNRQRDRAYARLCEWCGVCPVGKRNAEDCEIAALNPEPPKEEET